MGGYIQPEEVWACTTCNACGDACPIELDPMSIIIDLRRYLVMEKSSCDWCAIHLPQNNQGSGPIEITWKIKQSNKNDTYICSDD